MKKLFTICLLLATTFTVSAQQKPTKEETVAFINRTTSQTIGTHYLFGKMTETKFTYDNYSFTQTGEAGDVIFTQNDTYSGISWETLNPEWINTINDKGKGQTGISIGFSKNMKYEKAFTNQANKIEYKNFLVIIIPTEKFESIKKACLRLAEIA